MNWEFVYGFGCSGIKNSDQSSPKCFFSEKQSQRQREAKKGFRVSGVGDEAVLQRPDWIGLGSKSFGKLLAHF